MKNEKKYFTFDENGNIGVHDVSKARAEQDLEYNQRKYPDDNWQMAEQD